MKPNHNFFLVYPRKNYLIHRMKFEYKQFSPSLLEDLHYLFRVFRKKKQHSIKLKKKYHTKEFGAQYIGFLAYDCNNNLPIGFYGVLPIEAIHFGEKIIIAQSADTITHPKYRKQGIFKILAKKTYSLCQKIINSISVWNTKL